MSRDTRSIVVETVEDNPGLNFTSLKEKTGLSNGVLQYHIRNSEQLIKKKGAIISRGVCSKCGFCGLCRDKCIQMVLRNDEKRSIVQMLAEGMQQNEIAEEMGLDKSTVSYHVKELRKVGVLDEDNNVVNRVIDSDWIDV